MSPILFLTFLFLTSTCFASLDDYISSESWFVYLGSYYVEQPIDIASISRYINTNTSNILKYNPNSIPSRDTHEKIAFATKEWILSLNTSGINQIHDSGNFNVTVVCSDGSISMDFRLFYSYRLRQKKPLETVSSAAKLLPDLYPFFELNKIQILSGSLDIFSWHHYFTYQCSSGQVHLVSAPNRCSFRRALSSEVLDGGHTRITRKRRNLNGSHPPLESCSGLSLGAIVGITTGVVVVVLFLAGCLYNRALRKKNVVISSTLRKNAQVQLMLPAQGGLAGISVNRSVDFSYEEISKATQDFSHANKIGQGGFGAVYYAHLRGEKVAIKKMDMQASKEFLAELKILTHVQHLNLVRLIGYCVDGSLFLVYDYIENGNLSQHLHGSGRDPLPWSIRVQIALDSARGLEYIHEYIVSTCIHCDIKSANILIDKNFHAKVADFGLSKLTGVGSTSHLGGTFGYMPPEYVQYGEVSPKVDVYAFGVVLYELISAKQAIVRGNDSDDEPKGLVHLFDEVLCQVDKKDDLVKMIDLRLGDSYPLDSVHKMAQLAKVCTHEDPKQRPSMRSIVVTLMMLSSSTED